MKIRLSARHNSRKPKKGAQNTPEHESVINTQEYHLALLECRTTLSKCQMVPLRAKAQVSLWDDKAHPFCLIHRKTRPNSHSTCHYLFFKHSSLYKQRLDLKIQHTLLDFLKLFYALKRDTFSHTRNSHIFLSPSLIFSQARVFRFQR